MSAKFVTAHYLAIENMRDHVNEIIPRLNKNYKNFFNKEEVSDNFIITLGKIVKYLEETNQMDPHIFSMFIQDVDVIGMDEDFIGIFHFNWLLNRTEDSSWVNMKFYWHNGTKFNYS